MPEIRNYKRNLQASLYHKLKGYFLASIGIVLFFFGLTNSSPLLQVCGIVIGIVAFIFGGLEHIKSKKHAYKRAEDVLANDHRPPVLFLRSFEMEVKDNTLSTYLRDMFLDRTLPGGESAWGPMEQEQLAGYMNLAGPYIAIGRPGEPLPERGPAWLYVTDENWQSVVKDYLKKSRMIVVRVGKSEGLLWEIAQLRRMCIPNSVLLILPQRKDQYPRVRRWAEKVFVHDMPEKFPRSRMIIFEKNWRPVELAVKQTLQETLAPFFLQNGIRLPKPWDTKGKAQNF